MLYFILLYHDAEYRNRLEVKVHAVTETYLFGKNISVTKLR